MNLCSVDSCEREHYALGFCRRHYLRAKSAEINAARRSAYVANIEHERSIRRVWRKANPEKVKATKQRHHIAHADKIKARVREWVRKNPEKRKANVRAWDKAHADVCAAKLANRRAKKFNATPSWANKFFIAEAYHLARLRTKMLGFRWHVDHIVPLDSEIVCGLHVEHNLQVIPAITNRRKGNRHWPDMPVFLKESQNG